MGVKGLEIKTLSVVCKPANEVLYIHMVVYTKPAHAYSP